NELTDSRVLRCMFPIPSLDAFGRRGNTVGCASSDQLSKTLEPSSACTMIAPGHMPPKLVLPVPGDPTIASIGGAGGFSEGLAALERKLIFIAPVLILFSLLLQNSVTR